MAVTGDPRLQAARDRVDQAKKKVETLIKLRKEGVKDLGNQIQKSAQEYEEAVEDLEKIRGDPHPPPPATARSYTDPHFVGFDGQHYEVMPEGASVLFSANTPPSQKDYYSFSPVPPANMSEKDFCVTGLHTCGLGRSRTQSSKQNSLPTWTTAIFIKIYDNTLYYDKDQNFLLNGVPAPLCDFFLTPNQEIMAGYYCLDDSRSFLEVWHPVFGRVVVQNAGRYNLNITFSAPREVLKDPEIQGIVVGKDKVTVWEPPHEIDRAMFNRVKAKNPTLSEEIIRDMVLDYQYTPLEIREEVLDLNLAAVEKQNKIIESEKNMVKWNFNPNDDDEEDEEEIERALMKVQQLNIRAERLMG